MKPILTERLLLRKWTEADAPILHQLNSDPEVMRYTGDIHVESVDHMINLIRNYSQYELYKMGRLLTLDRETNEVIGWCGLKYHPEEGYIDLGYRFFQKHWGKGYATEASFACLDYGFNELGLTKIVAHAVKENGASLRVMEKVGMTITGPVFTEGTHAIGARITKEEYDAFMAEKNQ